VTSCSFGNKKYYSKYKKMINKSASYGSFLAVAALGVAYFYADSESSINKFGEAVSEKLCDLLPRKEGQDEDGSSQTNVSGAQTTLSKGEL